MNKLDTYRTHADTRHTQPFQLGRSMMTRGINEAIASDSAFAADVARALGRHIAADFSDMEEEDRAANQRAIELGDERIFGSYKTSRGKVWIITEADRSATTILFPSEY
jgi:hypothetical protein